MLRHNLDRQPDANVSPGLVYSLHSTRHQLSGSRVVVVREFIADLRSLRKFSSTE